MPGLKKPAVPPIDTVMFRPDPRDGRKDFKIPRDVAKRLFEQDLIWGDVTNGGYCPRQGVNYNARQHKVD